MRALTLKHSVGAKIFGAFLLMGLLIGVLGVYGYGKLRASGRIVAQIYDGPLMATSYARAANVDFELMRNTMLGLSAAPPQARAKIEHEMDEQADALFADLNVADERGMEADEHAIIRDLRTLVHQWTEMRHASADDPRIAALEDEIGAKFDMLIELNADHGFIARRKSISAVSYYEYASMVLTVVALILAGGITFALSRRIIRPLSDAAAVANRIAAGELQTPIPQGGRDETGILLNSMTVMQDSIREMMEREKARAQSAEVRLMDALENSGEGVVLIDQNGTIVVVNSEVARFFPNIWDRLGAGSDLRTAMGLIETQFNRSSEQAQPSLADVVRKARFENTIRLERQLLDGRWLHLKASRTSEGGAIVFVSDFTEVKAREENLRTAKQEAEAASAAKSRFVANMSHELRTPLNAIIGFSEVISGQLFGTVGNARYADYAQDITRSGRHLLDIINSVLDLAKSEAGKMPLNAEPVDLRYVLLDCVKMLREQCAAAGLAFHEPQLNRELVVWGEKAKLRQVFLNLLSNAIKFTKRGGRISLRVREMTEHLVLEVNDTGIGMTANDIQTALTPFAQVDTRLERRYEGTGLGLPLAKSLVELHEGSLTIESTPGKGTTVLVRLDRMRSDQLAEAAVSGRA